MTYGLSALLKVSLLSVAFWSPIAAHSDGPAQQDRIQLPPCQTQTVFAYNPSDYTRMPHKQLIAMGEAGHPVGLYYMAEKAAQTGKNDRARHLLLRAAAAGLTHAYDRLSDLEKTNGNSALAYHYKDCATRQRASNVTNSVRKTRN